MKQIITKFNDKTGDFEITIPIPFTPKDGIEYVDMMVADIPKYEGKKDYNVFDLIRKNQELESQLDFIGEQNKYIDKLEKKVKELKKQYCERTDCSGRICNSKQYDSLVQRIENQQKEFIEWLKKMSKDLFKNGEYAASITYGFILAKYKEIVGDENE